MLSWEYFEISGSIRDVLKVEDLLTVPWTLYPFSKRNFDKVAAASVGQALLTQAKIDNVNVFELVDTLKGLSEVQLSKVVAQVLNFQRNKSSTIGFKISPTFEYGERRNVVV